MFGKTTFDTKAWCPTGKKVMVGLRFINMALKYILNLPMLHVGKNSLFQGAMS